MYYLTIRPKLYLLFLLYLPHVVKSLVHSFVHSFIHPSRNCFNTYRVYDAVLIFSRLPLLSPVFLSVSPYSFFFLTESWINLFLVLLAPRPLLLASTVEKHPLFLRVPVGQVIFQLLIKTCIYSTLEHIVWPAMNL